MIEEVSRKYLVDAFEAFKGMERAPIHELNHEMNDAEFENSVEQSLAGMIPFDNWLEDYGDEILRLTEKYIEDNQAARQINIFKVLGMARDAGYIKIT